MEGLFGSIDWPSAAVWSAFAFGAAFAAAAQSWGHARQAYFQWRLDRRLARDRYILCEEMNEHRLAIGDDLEPLDLSRVVAGALLGAVVYAFPVWLAEQHLEHWWQFASLAFGAFALMLAWWRWMNDPDSDPEALKLPKATIPRDAIMGFAVAIAVVALFAVAAIWLL